MDRKTQASHVQKCFVIVTSHYFLESIPPFKCILQPSFTSCRIKFSGLSPATRYNFIVKTKVLAWPVFVVGRSRKLVFIFGLISHVVRRVRWSKICRLAYYRNSEMVKNCGDGIVFEIRGRGTATRPSMCSFEFHPINEVFGRLVALWGMSKMKR